MEISRREKRKIIINEIVRFLGFVALAAWFFDRRNKK